MCFNVRLNFRVLILSILLFTSFNFVSAQTYSLGSISNYTTFRSTANSNSSSLTTCNCPSGKVMVGFEGREGGLVDNFKIICATLNSNGSLSNVSVVNTQVGSSSGGSYYYETFSSPVAMVGANVRVGDELDALTGRGNTIANIGSSSSNSSYTNSLSQFGGSGGASYNDYAPNGYVFVGIRYRSGPYGGGVQFAYAPITVCTPATAPTSITGTTTICSGSSTTLTASGGTLGSGGYYQWYADGCGSGSSLGSGASITVSPTSTTTYYVRRVANCGGTTACYSVTVNVNSNSTAPTAISGSSSICAGSSSTLTASGGSSGTGSSFQWYAGGCGTGTSLGSGSSINVSPSSTTTYYVRRTGTCNTTSCFSQTITVNPLPTVSGGPDKTVCHGTSVLLSGSGANSYSWNNGVSNNVSFVPTQTATYTVTGTSVSGCINTDQVVINLPVAGSSLSQNNENATCVVNQNGWVHFYHSSGRLIASINSQGQDLGSVTATSYVEGSPITVDACTSSNPIYSTSVMGRHWVITPTNQPTSAVLVRFPYSSNEINTLTSAASTNQNANDDLLSPADLGLTKYSNGTSANVNNNASDNCGVGSSTFITQISNGVSTMYSSVNANYVDFSITGFSEFWLHGSSQSSPLPVELTNFTASCEEGNGISIKWSTASEHNSSYFEVLKSEDGHKWRNIAIVSAAGNSVNHIDYGVVDAEKMNGTVYYKLMQYDIDGLSKEYGPISSTCSSLSEMVVKTYPNPSSQEFYIEIIAPESTTTVIAIIDAHGKTVYSRTVDTEKGANLYTFEGLNILPGMYYIQISNDLTTPNVVKHSFR